MGSALRVIESVTQKQHAVIARSQLVELGISSSRIDRLVASGSLRRLRRGVYAVTGAPETWERGLVAAVLAGGVGAVASHGAAARLWQFCHRPDDRYEITIPRRHVSRLTGVGIHETLHLAESDVAMVQGIPATSFERTLCDVTTGLTVFQLGRVLDDGLRRNVASISKLKACAERLESGPGRHMTAVRALLAERNNGFDPGGSAAELRVLDVVRRAGLPLPAQQHVVHVGKRRFVLDYAWVTEMVLGEYYGLNVHSLPSSVARDSERISLLVAAGWRPLIFTDATSDRAIEEQVRNALQVP